MIKPSPFPTLSVLVLCLLAAGGCDRKEETPATPAKVEPATKPVAATGSSAAQKSAEPNSFDEVAARLDRGGSLYFYLSAEQWLSTLSQQLGSLRDVLLTSAPIAGEADREMATKGFKVLTDVVKTSGLEEVTGFGASSFAVEPGVHRNTLFVHHYPGKGKGFLWSSFGKAPHPLKALDLLPADTALANFGDLDLATLFGAVRRTLANLDMPEATKGLDEALEQFSKVAGMSVDDLLRSLGGSVGFVLTLDPASPITLPVEGGGTIPTPRLALVFQVNDDRIFKQIDTTLAANPAIEKVDEPDLRMRTMPMPTPLQAMAPTFEFRPSVAQWGGYLTIASDDKLVRAMIDALKTGKGYKATPEFAKLSKGLPAEGNGFQLGTQRFADLLNRLPEILAKAQPALALQQQAFSSGVFGSSKSGPVYSVSSHVENGWLVVGKGSQGAGQILAPLLLVPAAVAAGVALPALSKAREQFAEVQSPGPAAATQSLSQAKQIATACKAYASDNDGKFPPTLEALVPKYLPDAKLFVSPFEPEVPMGYAYAAGLTDKSPPETVLLEDRYASQKGKRVIVHVDMSGEVK
jgi:hypothetical protein